MPIDEQIIAELRSLSEQISRVEVSVELIRRAVVALSQRTSRLECDLTPIPQEIGNEVTP